MTITIESGPLWVDLLSAIATAAAAVFAGWAAWSARAAAIRSKQLVEVEQARDLRLEKVEMWRQARRVTVDLFGQEIFVPPDDQPAHDMHLTVTNAGPDPIFKARIRIELGDATWGPQLVGTLGPWGQIRLTARLFTSVSPDNANAFVRFLDVEGRPWISNARTEVVSDEEGVDIWIAGGREFAGRDLSIAERGTIEGAVMPPDLDSWRAQVADYVGQQMEE